MTTIVITNEDIEAAARHRAEDVFFRPTVNCPIAIAVQRALDDEWLAVDQTLVYNDQTGKQVGILSDNVSSFQRAFDDSEYPMTTGARLPMPIIAEFTSQIDPT